MTSLAHFAETPAVAASMWLLGLMHPALSVLLGIPPTQVMTQPLHPTLSLVSSIP